MDFEDTPEEAAFRAEVRAWLTTHAPVSPDQTLPRRADTATGAADLPDARALQRALHEASLAGITWPTEHGGRGGTVMEQIIFNQEVAKYELPFQIFSAGISLAAPAIMAFGTEAQKDRFLPPMLTGEDIWVQLFSEPGAGSDLAGMRSKAIQDGDEWVLSGQKVWSSGAGYANWGLAPVRTDPSAPKHRGLSYFVVDMNTPGITIRPLKQISGHAHFAEVFLDEVRVPADCLIGEPGQGWAVTQTTLMSERNMIGAFNGGEPEPLIELARRTERNGRPAVEDPVIRQALVDIHIRKKIIDLIGYRLITAISQGREPGPEGSVGKIAVSQLLKRSAELGLELQGASGMIGSDDADDDGVWEETFLCSPSMRIAGGTDEIQRNILGERVLGLPREPDENRKKPFNEIAV